jgi:hypothetical protein
MHIEGLGRVILAALGVCVLAVIVALLLPHILWSAPVLEIREWFDRLPPSPYPCSYENWRTRKANYASPPPSRCGSPELLISRRRSGLFTQLGRREILRVSGACGWRSAPGARS